MKSFLTNAALILILVVAAVMTANAQTFKTLVRFHGFDGYGPSPLVQTTGGNLYATAAEGGVNNHGTIFKITARGLSTLYNFCSQPRCTDGSRPVGLIEGTDGNFYGTTMGGGTNDAGTFFKITPAGVVTTLHSFDGRTDGRIPKAGLLQAADGNFYGTMSAGGAYDYGTVLKITPSGKLTTLYSFCSQRNCTDGAVPAGGLIQATDGNFYGATTSGGVYDYNGTIFKITRQGSLITLHSFDSVDGAHPSSALVEASDGNFYGTTANGAAGSGTVFKITKEGTLTTLHRFDGEYPGGLIQATDGNFYGTTSGGSLSSGTVFQITSQGTSTTLHTFTGDDGFNPLAALLQATDGNFYGTTSAGTHFYGTVFSLSMGLGPFVSFLHNPARVGGAFGILGHGFSGTSSVLLNGTPASFRVVSNTCIRAIVPAGGTTGYVTVTTPDGTLTSNVPFHVIP